MFILNFFQLGFDKEKNLPVTTTEQNLNLKSCSVNKLNISNNIDNLVGEKKIIYEASDLNIFPEINNFYCLGKIIQIQENVDNNKVVFFIGTNRFLFNFFNIVINFSLILMIILGLITSSKLFLFFVFFNFFNFHFFRSELNILKSVFPYTNPETYNEIYFLNILFLIIFVSKLKNENLKITFLYLLVFFIPDYLGLFSIVLFLFSKSTFNLESKFSLNYLLFLPPIFYIMRTIYSTNSYFDQFWMFSGQRVYHGTSRFYDGLWNFEAMACIKNPNLFDNVAKACRELNAGYLDNFVYITTDPYITTLIFMAIMHFLIIIIYFDILKNFDFNKVIVALLFISPSINFLTFQGNFDVLFFVVSYFVLTKFSRFKLFVLIIMFILSLYKLHAIGAIFGILVYFLRNKDFKYVYINLILIIVSLYFALSEIFSNSIVYGFGSLEISYGLLHLSNQFETFLGLNEYLIFLFLICGVFFTLFFLRESKFYLEDKTMSQNYLHYDALTYWLMFTLLTINNSYRLPIFFLLFLKYFHSKSQILSISAFIFIFLSIVPVTNYSFFIILFDFIKHLSFAVFLVTVTKIELGKLAIIVKKNKFNT